MVMRSMADCNEKTATEGVIRMLEVVRYALEMLEGVHRVLLCMLEAVEGGLCLREVSEVLEVMEVPEVMPCVLLRMLEAVEGGLCLREVSEVMR